MAFYGCCSYFEHRKGKSQEELQKEIECNKYTISTYGEIRENGEKRMQIWKKKQELSRKIELSFVFGELRENWTISKKIKSGKKMEKKEGKCGKSITRIS